MTTFKVTNRTGRTLNISGQAILPGDYIDLLPLWANGQLEDTEDDVEGQNAGKALNGSKILDVVAEKQSIEFVSQIIDHASCVALKELAKSKPITVSTDIFTADERTYQMFALSRTITHVVGQYCKVSFSLMEV